MVVAQVGECGWFLWRVLGRTFVVVRRTVVVVHGVITGAAMVVVSALCGFAVACW